MDFKDLNNKPHPIDRNFVPAGETQPANALLQNIRNKFAGSTSGISEKEFHEIKECARMLEKYVSRFPSTKGSVTFDAKDRTYWVSTFYPHFIQKGQQLTDDKFFSSCDTTLGIGTDGKFTGYELFQSLYRLYKETVQKLSE